MLHKYSLLSNQISISFNKLIDRYASSTLARRRSTLTARMEVDHGAAGNGNHVQQSRRSTAELSSGPPHKPPLVDDDGRPLRTGTLWTASAHIITAVIGSGVLSLAWAIAQLGWVIGPVVLLAFSAVTWFCSSLLADCYRAPDPVHGKRNYTYGQAVRAYLGMSLLCPSSTFKWMDSNVADLE